MFQVLQTLHIHAGLMCMQFWKIVYGTFECNTEQKAVIPEVSKYDTRYAICKVNIAAETQQKLVGVSVLL